MQAIGALNAFGNRVMEKAQEAVGNKPAQGGAAPAPVARRAQAPGGAAEPAPEASPPPPAYGGTADAGPAHLSAPMQAHPNTTPSPSAPVARPANTNSPPPASASPSPQSSPQAGGGATTGGFMTSMFAKGKQIVPDVKKHKDELTGQPMRDITTKDFDVKKFEENTCLNRTFFRIAQVASFSPILTVALDVYTLYSLSVNPFIYRWVFVAYLVVFCVSLGFVLWDCHRAVTLRAKDDMSMIVITEYACLRYQAQSLAHYCFVSKITGNFSLIDGALLKVLNVMDNGLRMVVITIPQVVLSFIALTMRNGVVGDAELNKVGFGIRVVPLVLKIVSLAGELQKLFYVVCLYFCLRCLISTFIKSGMSLTEYLNLKVEKILNKMANDGDFGRQAQVSVFEQGAAAAVSVA